MNNDMIKLIFTIEEMKPTKVTSEHNNGYFKALCDVLEVIKEITDK